MGVRQIEKALAEKSKTQIPFRIWKWTKETGNELAPEYYIIKPEVLWYIVKYELPPLKPLTKQIMDELKR